MHLADALAYVLPVPCAGCGAEGRALCSSCCRGLVGRVSSRDVARVGAVTSALRYDGVARAAILALKEQGSTVLAAQLARPFALSVNAALAGVARPVLAAVPSTRARVGAAVTSRCGCSRAAPASAIHGCSARHDRTPRRRRSGSTTVGATSRGRSRSPGPSPASASCSWMTWSRPARRSPAAATVLRDGGAEVLGAAVLADTPRRSGHSSATLSLAP